MNDLFTTTVMCDACNKKTTKGFVVKDTCHLRVWKCDTCHKVWYHPNDLQEYQEFKKIRGKTFQVKLRMVGNSYTVSIPREIIEFQEDLQQHINKILYLTLEEPEKLSIFFKKELKKMMESETW